MWFFFYYNFIVVKITFKRIHFDIEGTQDKIPGKEKILIRATLRFSMMFNLTYILVILDAEKTSHEVPCALEKTKSK